MQSVVELTGRILQVRNVERGETVGYGATWTAKRASRIAVVALGYADGLLRAASGTDRAAGRHRHRRRQALPDRRPHLDGSGLHRHHRSARRRRPPRRHRDLHRRGNHRRRCRRARPAPSATRSLPASARAAISSIAALEPQAELDFCDGRARTKLRLPELRRRLRALGRPLRSLRRLEHAGRGRRGATARVVAQGPAVRHRAAQGRIARSAAARLRHRRIRPRDRRRPGARLGAAARRRSRHRQIDAADRGRGRLRAQPAPRGLYFRRGSGGPGAAARRTARPCRRRRRTRGRNLGRGYRGDAVARRDAAAPRHRFDPDHVDADRRSGARHGDAGARLGRRTDPLRQAHRRRRDPGRPRHQGRPDRRARASSSTWSMR